MRFCLVKGLPFFLAGLRFEQWQKPVSNRQHFAVLLDGLLITAHEKPGIFFGSIRVFGLPCRQRLHAILAAQGCAHALALGILAQFDLLHVLLRQRVELGRVHIFGGSELLPGVVVQKEVIPRCNFRWLFLVSRCQEGHVGVLHLVVQRVRRGVAGIVVDLVGSLEHAAQVVFLLDLARHDRREKRLSFVGLLLLVSLQPVLCFCLFVRRKGVVVERQKFGIGFE